MRTKVKNICRVWQLSTENVGGGAKNRCSNGYLYELCKNQYGYQKVAVANDVRTMRDVTYGRRGMLDRARDRRDSITHLKTAARIDDVIEPGRE